ncbi:ubiquitin-conjugating enzyme E2 R1-like isoform X1 [Lates japonicus]|uniref:Ubiquitin-conjugating enzyme E2 R1-like isoform X1 n=1 Tax=Lates japonicus TaxID=270547 RepID=A0AAD3RC41_LATJO|nr:ubiquitin-conjugating enzyme E2 R1-like isoform X1 [Lates japonicus]
MIVDKFIEPLLVGSRVARIKFPVDYPYSPPAFRFLTKMWHPNIYENGDVCISILHPPVDDPQSGELPSERWNPTQNSLSSPSGPMTILLSVNLLGRLTCLPASVGGIRHVP